MKGEVAMKKSGFSVRGVTLSAMFAALLVVISFVNIHFSFSPVPISLENFAIMLAASVLGARYGLFSIGTVVVLTAIGFPLLHGSGGLALLLGPTGGFIWMYPVSAFLIGLIVPRIKSKGVGGMILVFLTLELFGSLLLYVTGVPWLAHAADVSLSKAMVLGCYPYLPGDAVKAVLGTVIWASVRQWVPVLQPQSRGGYKTVHLD